MTAASLTNIDWLFYLIFGILAIILFYQAWNNIIFRKVSKYSIDGLCVFIANKIGTEKMKQNAQAFTQNKIVIVFFGICALLAGLRAIQEIVVWFNTYGLR